uniref:Putative secreted protein n=1 Tax=Anopheles triannulatus TaxID=58253 RepID=A0A2M4B7K2_9DIPT
MQVLSLFLPFTPSITLFAFSLHSLVAPDRCWWLSVGKNNTKEGGTQWRWKEGPDRYPWLLCNYGAEECKMITSSEERRHVYGLSSYLSLSRCQGKQREMP